MAELGYSTALVENTTEPTIFSVEDIDLFDKLNKEGIGKMNADLQEENPADYERRIRQAAVLSLETSEILGDWSEASKTSELSELASILTDAEVEARFVSMPYHKSILANRTYKSPMCNHNRNQPYLLFPGPHTSSHILHLLVPKHYPPFWNN